MWQGWVNGILGVWLVVAAFISLGTQGDFWNDIVVGIVAAVVGFLMVKAKPWQGWLTGLVGLWLIAAAFIPGLTGQTGNFWNDLAVGVLLMIGGFSAVGHSRHTLQASH